MGWGGAERWLDKPEGMGARMIRIPISETSGWEEDATPCIATSGERRELNGAGSTAAAAGWGLAGERAEWTARRRRMALGWPAPGIAAGRGAGMTRQPKLPVDAGAQHHPARTTA